MNRKSLALDARPSALEPGVNGERIVKRMKQYVDVSVRRMVA